MLGDRPGDEKRQLLSSARLECGERGEVGVAAGEAELEAAVGSTNERTSLNSDIPHRVPYAAVIWQSSGTNDPVPFSQWPVSQDATQ